MKNVIRVAIVDPSDASRQALKTLLLGIDMVWLDADCHRYEFFIDVIGKSQPDLAMISLDNNAAKGLELIAKVTQTCPACYVVVLSTSQEGSVILQAIRNGAKEFLQLPLKIDDFLAALKS
jgi:pilus assembly protein CpaE